MALRAGIVFDNDGLLLDTEPCWTRAETAVFERHGHEFDLEAKRALVGTAPETAARVLERLLELPGRGEEVSTELYALALEEIAAGAEPRPGAVDLLAGLTRTGFRDRFDAVIGVEDVAEPKPAPDLYLRACELLGASPTHSLALEDSPPGVAAARAAGLYVVGVPSVAGVELEADAVFESLADPNVLATIVERLD
jgi:HAD superfamily hydrolase (TIGR01509 family)